MKKMRLLVLSTLFFTGANAQNLTLDTWSSSTTATGWTSPMDGFQIAVPGEDAPVNQATGVSGSCARLNPIDMSAIAPIPIIASIFGIGEDADSDMLPDGIAYTTRIESIDFQVKYNVAGDAAAVIEVYMINGEDTIGTGTMAYSEEISSFTAQNMVIEYDPQFDGVDPTTLSFLVGLIGEDPASTDADFYIDEIEINDLDNASLSSLDANLWSVSANNNQIIVTGVNAGDVLVYNTAGQILGTASVVNGIATVDVNNNASGVLMVQLNSGNETGLKKIILMK